MKQLSTQRSYPSKVAANGQVVIPKELRKSLGLRGGDTVLFCTEERHSGVVKVELRKPSLSFTSLVGIFKGLKGRPLHEILKEQDEEEMR